jgi:putative heme iron utilization protein
MNTRLLETCRKQYGLISQIKKTVNCGGSYYVCVTQGTVQKREDASRPFSPFMQSRLIRHASAYTVQSTVTWTQMIDSVRRNSQIRPVTVH